MRLSGFARMVTLRIERHALIRYFVDMTAHRKLPSLARLREVFAPFCAKYGISRLEVFGSVARGGATPESDVDLLVTFGRTASVGDLLEMAGEAEELAGAPVDFVLRESLERSPNRLAREEILKSAVWINGCDVNVV